MAEYMGSQSPEKYGPSLEDAIVVIGFQMTEPEEMQRDFSQVWLQLTKGQAILLLMDLYSKAGGKGKLTLG